MLPRGLFNPCSNCGCPSFTDEKTEAEREGISNLLRATWLLSDGGLMVVALAPLGDAARNPREFSSGAGEKRETNS